MRCLTSGGRVGVGGGHHQGTNAICVCVGDYSCLALLQSYKLDLRHITIAGSCNLETEHSEPEKKSFLYQKEAFPV